MGQRGSPGCKCQESRQSDEELNSRWRPNPQTRAKLLLGRKQFRHLRQKPSDLYVRQKRKSFSERERDKYRHTLAFGRGVLVQLRRADRGAVTCGMQNVESGSRTESNEERVVQEQKSEQNTHPSMALGSVPADCRWSVHICAVTYDNWSARRGQGEACTAFHRARGGRRGSEPGVRRSPW